MRLYVYLLALMMGVNAWATEKVMSLETTTETKHSGISTQREIDFQSLRGEIEEDYSDDELQQVFVSSKKAAEKGDAGAQFNLGLMYYLGREVEQDFVQAAKWFKKAAEQGHAAAQYQLGNLYSRGTGVAKNNDEAIKYYTQAANQGNTDALYILGNIYQDGLVVEQDFKEAAKWYRKAASQGFKNAQARLDKLCDDNPSACE